MSCLGGYDQNDSEEFQIVDPRRRPCSSTRRRPRTINAGLSYNRADQTRVLGLTLNGGSSFYGGGTTQNVGPTKRLRRRPDLVDADRQRVAVFVSSASIYDSLYSRRRRSSRIAGDIAIDELPGSDDAGRRGARFAVVGDDPRPRAPAGPPRTRSTAASATRCTRYSGEATGDNTLARARASSSARQMQRTTALTMSYGYSSGEYAPLIDGGGTRPLVGHVIQGGMNFSKRLSPRRARAVLVQRRRHAHGGGDRRRPSSATPSGRPRARHRPASTSAGPGRSRATTATARRRCRA